MIDRIMEFVDTISKEDGVYFYSTGAVCEAAIDFLRTNYDLNKIKAIITSDADNDQEQYCGIAVKYIEDESIDKDMLTVITDRENSQEELAQKLVSYGFKNIEQMSDNFALYLMKKLRNKKLGEDNEFLLNKVRDQLLRFVPRPCMEYMVLNILDHCNLRCKGCDHFACIADPYFVPYETLHRDLRRMSEILHGDNLMQIGVMGGEPLLHPELLKILRDVRENFPYTIIRLSTNGLLLLQQKDEFWQVCRDYDVTIVNTKYPIKIDHEKIKEKAQKEGVKFQYFRGSGDDNVKTSFKKVITLEGTHNPVKSFAKCHISNFGNFLMEGKLYGCPFSCQSYRIFNKKFNQNLRLTEKDYLDIYQIQDMQEIFEFAAKPRPYCRYCSELKRGYEWSRTSQDISEWVEGV